MPRSRSAGSCHAAPAPFREPKHRRHDPTKLGRGTVSPERATAADGSSTIGEASPTITDGSSIIAEAPPTTAEGSSTIAEASSTIAEASSTTAEASSTIGEASSTTAEGSPMIGEGSSTTANGVCGRLNGVDGAGWLITGVDAPDGPRPGRFSAGCPPGTARNRQCERCGRCHDPAPLGRALRRRPLSGNQSTDSTTQQSWVVAPGGQTEEKRRRAEATERRRVGAMIRAAGVSTRNSPE